MKERQSDKENMMSRLTATGQVTGQALVVHKHFTRAARVRDCVLSSHVSTDNPEPEYRGEEICSKCKHIHDLTLKLLPSMLQIPTQRE